MLDVDYEMVDDSRLGSQLTTLTLRRATSAEHLIHLTSYTKSHLP